MGVSREDRRLIKIAAQRYRIHPHVLAGLTDVETGGQFRADLTSPAGAFGETQFMPGTAASHGVIRGTSHHAKATQFLGAAKYLVELGYHSDRRKALASYNGGPGNPQYGYADEVLSRAHKYYKTGFFSGVGGGGAAAGGGGGRSGGRRSASVTTSPGTISRGAVEPGGSGLADFLGALQQRSQPSPPIHGLARPAFAAGPPLPKGYQQLESSGAPPAPDTSLSDLLQGVSDLQGGDVPHSTVSAPSGSVVVHGGGGGGSGRGGKGGGGRDGTTKVTLAPGADRAGVPTSHYLRRKLSEIPGIPGGITITTGSNHNRLTVDGNVSDHWGGKASDIAVPVDSARGDLIAGRALMTLGHFSRQQARQMARQGGLFTFQGRDGKRWQVIWKTTRGGNHHNHVHVGVE